MNKLAALGDDYLMRFKKDDDSGKMLLRTITNSRDGNGFRYDI